MNNEYEFFKQFAGVTESDLQMYKCGGKSKKVQKDCGGGCTAKIKMHQLGGLQKKKPTYNNELPSVSTRVSLPENLRNNKMTSLLKSSIEENRKKASVKNISNKTLNDKRNQFNNKPFLKLG